MIALRALGCRARPYLAAFWLSMLACRESYRIGDHVMVEYDGQHCPGYVIDKKSETRVRVHFDFEGYNWQDDVSVDRLLGRVEEPVQGCALPARVRLTEGCDRQLATCAARFGNAVKFRGEAQLPGNDLLTRYPGG